MRDKDNFLLGKDRRPVLVRQFLSLLLTVFISQLLFQWFQNDLNISLVYRFTFVWHTEKFLISLLILLLPAVWLWAVSGSVLITQVLYLFTSTVIGFITFEKMNQRGEPLYPADFNMISQVGFLLKMLTLGRLILIMTLLILGISLFVWLLKKEKERHRVKLTKRTRILMVILSSLGMFYLSRFQAEGNIVKKAYDRTAHWIPYSQQMNYYNNGFVAGFLYNLSSSAMAKPEGYSRAKMNELLIKYQEKAAEINANRAYEKLDANIVYIMNESFADPHQLDKTNKEWDPIPFSRELAKRHGSGKMLSQGYGGGTANVEFEALTGFSMEPFKANVTTPFTQFLPETKLPSIVSRLKEDQFTATAIHPFDTSMYKRRDNYANLGFDAFYYDETMIHTDKIGNNSYISDQAAYDEVLYHMAESTGFDFVHLVTMQNHTPYTDKYDETPSWKQTGYKDERINQYFQDLVYSDAAMERFFQELEDFDEHTIVVFWGDHWPNVFGEDMRDRLGEELFYQTPVYIFSNQNDVSKDLGVISPIYFFNEVLELANGKVSGFDAFLLALQKEVPAFEKGMYYNKEQSKYVHTREKLSAEAQKLLEEYDWFMYDTITGEKTGTAQGFFRQPN